MVHHLAITLDIPLRARNGLLTAAGFAPSYSEEPFDGEALATIRERLQTLADAHDPYPAYVIDQHWNIVLANDAAARLTGMLLDPAHALDLGFNLMRAFLHPNGMRSHVVNWDEAATLVLGRLRAECDAHPGAQGLRELLREAEGYEGIAELRRPADSDPGFLTTLHLRHEGREGRFHTAIMTLLEATDVTVSELRLETLLPADPASESWLRELRAS